MAYIHVHAHILYTVHTALHVCVCYHQEPGDGPGDGGDRPTTADFENCKQLDDSLHLAWTVDRSSESVEFMLCGCTSSDIAQ